MDKKQKYTIGGIIGLIIFLFLVFMGISLASTVAGAVLFLLFYPCFLIAFV